MPDFVQTAVKAIDDQLRILKDEAARLAAARAALSGGPRRRGRPATNAAARTSARPASRRNTRATKSQPAASATRANRAQRTAASTPATNGRSTPGATKASVLAALAGGEAMTAGQVATQAGLARPTVSTTLSKLAKTGEVQKAERGYRLSSTA